MELRWADVDLDHGVLNVSRAWDSREDREKLPNTRNRIRTIPIHPNLKLLLERLHEDATSEPVVPILSRVPEDAVAEHSRRHLQAAGITRLALFADTATTVQVNFRSWLAMTGLGVDKIMRRAGP